MLAAGLTDWFTAEVVTWVAPSARRMGDAASLAHVAERMSRHLKDNSAPWLEVAAFAAQWGRAPELDALVDRMSAIPETAVWARATGLFFAAIGRDSVELSSRLAACPKLRDAERLRLEPIATQARAIAGALRGDPAMLAEAVRAAGTADVPELLWMAWTYRFAGLAGPALDCLTLALKKDSSIHPQPATKDFEMSYQESPARPLFLLWSALAREVGQLRGALMPAQALSGENVPDFERWSPLLQALQGAGPAVGGQLSFIQELLGPTGHAWPSLVRAAAMLESGQTAEAGRLLRQARAKFAADLNFEPAELLRLEARCAEQTGKTSEAILLWNLAAAAADALPGEGHRARARAALLRGDSTVEGAELRGALALDRSDWEALLALADRERRVGDPGAAVPMYRRALVFARFSRHPSAVAIVSARVKELH
ncbi:MAG: hypothetical protein HY303_18475 [Candidatus Wallbacteria bacterium]|nr:hypothetical protein [Candidatus Wallbacteria bacterium]